MNVNHQYLRLPQVLTLLLLALTAHGQQRVVDTKHNLSASGPGTVHAVSEQRVCIFCHTPHGSRAVAPLWNRRDSGAAYIPYNSPTLKASPGQPTGSSKLCLSCHDGAIAMGDLVSESAPVQMSGSQKMTSEHGLIGTDLRGEHPISFSYLDSLAQLGTRLTAPGTWDPRVKLDAGSELQCTTCHDPHNDQYGKFMVMDNQQAALCRVCHKYDNFATTAHATSTKQWNGSGVNPWPHTDYKDVATNACLNCHTSHHAGGRNELVTFAQEESVCFVCHDGAAASYNLQADFQKTYHHPVERTQGVHQDGENPVMSGDHVECADCHNPHRAHHADAQAPNVKGALEGVSGVDANGGAVAESAYEYQICFKCHANTTLAPTDAIERRLSTRNLRLKFSTSSPSFHPVEGPRGNVDAPSLLTPLAPDSVIYCSDCHNNDTAQPTVPASGGPHGSSVQFILAADYRTGDDVGESPQAYALCYKCHNRTSILADESFKKHNFHVATKRAPCSICHDAHGIDYTQGNSVNNAALINFDTKYVSPDSVSGKLQFTSSGGHSGECYLRCHGIDHSPKTY